MTKRAQFKPTDPMMFFSLVAATLSITTGALLLSGVATMF